MQLSDILLSKGLDVLIGTISVAAIALRFRAPKGDLTQKDLFRLLEEKNKEIERLQIEIKGWHRHHKQLTNK